MDILVSSTSSFYFFEGKVIIFRHQNIAAWWVNITFEEDGFNLGPYPSIEGALIAAQLKVLHLRSRRETDAISFLGIKSEIVLAQNKAGRKLFGGQKLVNQPVAKFFPNPQNKADYYQSIKQQGKVNLVVPLQTIYREAFLAHCLGIVFPLGLDGEYPIVYAIAKP